MPLRKIIRRAAGALSKKKTKMMAKPKKMGRAKAVPESKGKRIGRKIGGFVRRNKKALAVGAGAGGVGYALGRRKRRRA